MSVFANIKSLFIRESTKNQEFLSIYDKNQELIQELTCQIQDTCHQLIQISEPQHEQFNPLYEQLCQLCKNAIVKLPSDFVYSDAGNAFFTAIAYTKLYYWIRSTNYKKEHELELILSEEITNKKRLSPTIRTAVQRICFEESTDQNKYEASLEYFRKMCTHKIDKLSPAEILDE